MKPTEVTRVQTGVRIEKRLLKVLKGIAESLDLTLGNLLEGVLLHAFEGKAPFGPQTLQQIKQLREIYGLDLSAADSHNLFEKEEGRAIASRRPRTPVRKRRT
jgi:hypothetical protein